MEELQIGGEKYKVGPWELKDGQLLQGLTLQSTTEGTSTFLRGLPLRKVCRQGETLGRPQPCIFLLLNFLDIVDGAACGRWRRTPFLRRRLRGRFCFRGFRHRFADLLHVL